MVFSSARFRPAPGRRHSVALMVSLAALLTGCTLGPDFSEPAAPAQTGYTKSETPTPPAPGGDETQQHFVLGKKIADDWWTLFQSPTLNGVLEEAVQGSKTVEAAQATLAEAAESVNQAAGALYPHLALNTSAERQRFSFAAFGFPGLPPSIFSTYGITPTATFDVDPFGGNRRRVEEAAAQAQYQEYQLDAAYLTLTGNVVSQAVTIASVRAQIAAVDDIIANDRQNLSLVQTEFKAGEATQLDIESATSQLATDRTLLPPLRQQLDIARHALAILAGKAPAEWAPPDFALGDLVLPQELPVSLPSELVHQRPDILASEARLHVATATIGVATAALYPDINLSATIGQDALTPTHLFMPASNVWTIVGQLSAPVFEGGALEAQKHAAEDAFDVAYANYQQTVLTSFGQIADLLVGLSHDAELLQEERQALQAAEASLKLTRTTYSVGNAGLLQVLDAQRLYEQARLGFVRAEAQRYVDTVQLFVAMGGGWAEWRKRAATAAAAAATK